MLEENDYCFKNVNLPPLTPEKALQEALASARIEGFSFSKKEIEKIKKFGRGEITIEEVME